MGAAQPVDRQLRALGILGFSSLTAAIVVAHNNPATSYELSIYAATPDLFWVGVGVAVLVSLFVAFTAGDHRHRTVALVLGGLACMAVISLPILRGYYFTGIHDSLTHVGWARALVRGTVQPSEIIYPGGHTVGAFIEGVAGLSIWHSMLLVPRVTALVYIVFVPLTVSEILDNRAATTVGAFSAFLLVPLHLIANTINVHPSSQAILLAPMAIYLLVRYLRWNDSDRYGVFTAVGLLFLVVTVALILYHPQQALNLVALLAAMSLFQFVLRRRSRTIRRMDPRPVYSIAGVAALAYVAWVLQFPWIPRLATSTVRELLFFSRTPPNPGSAVASQTFALQAIGVSLPVVFVKLFLVGTLFLALAGLVLFAAFLGRFRRGSVGADTTSLLRYLGVGLASLVPIFALYFLADVSVYYFREAGFVMMLATILGAIGITYGVWSFSTGRSRRDARLGHLAVASGFVVLLLLSTMVVYNSPYIHKANQQVTEARVDGYGMAFETTPDSAFISGIRQDPERYHEALVNMSDSGRLDGNVNSTEIHRLRRLRPGAWYLMMSRNTYERELVAYRGYRYSRSDLASVRRQVGVNLVQVNGDTELYYVSST